MISRYQRELEEFASHALEVGQKFARDHPVSPGPTFSIIMRIASKIHANQNITDEDCDNAAYEARNVSQAAPLLGKQLSSEVDEKAADVQVDSIFANDKKHAVFQAKLIYLLHQTMANFPPPQSEARFFKGKNLLATKFFKTMQKSTISLVDKYAALENFIKSTNDYRPDSITTRFLNQIFPQANMSVASRIVFWEYFLKGIKEGCDVPEKIMCCGFFRLQRKF